MDLAFKLQTFEGPLDLLLHLIEKNKVDIMDIPIAMITDQYFAYVEEMRRQDMDVMSDFLVMAATLLEIKAKMLLPAEKDEEGEEIDPRSDLAAQLLEYKMNQYRSEELREREEEASLTMYHEEDIPPEVKGYRESVDLDKLLGGVTLPQLRAVFLEVMRRQKDRIDPVRSTFGRIERETSDSARVMRSVERRIMNRKKCTFRSLLTARAGKTYVVVTFLTVLELMRMGRVEAVQDDTSGEIMISARDRSQWDSEYEDISLDSI